MDCPTCLKPYPDDATECPHCAVTASNPSSDFLNSFDMSRKSAQQEAPSEAMVDSTNDGSGDSWWDLVQAAGNKSQEPEEKQPDDPGESLAESMGNSWDSFTSQFNEATQDKDSGDSDEEEPAKSSFVLPSQATLSSSRAMPAADEGKKKSLSLDPPPTPKAKLSPFAPPKSEKPQAKVYGRSSEVQEAPLHDSWSSRSDGSPAAPEKGSWGGWSSDQNDSQQDSWSARDSSQEQGSPDNTWAAALKSAASEPTGNESPVDKDPIQGTEVPRPMAVEDIPEEEPADPDAKLENLPEPTAEPKEKKKGLRVVFGLLTVLLVLLALGTVAPAAYHYFTNRVAVPSDSSTPDSDSPLKDDASIWLASAQESLDSKDFKLAVAQLEKAISFLKKGEGEQGRLKETQVLLATTYSKAGDYTASATLWTELAKSHSNLRKKGKAAAAAAFRENRVIANKKVKAGEKAVSNKKFDNAIKVANEALDLYAVSQGQNSQMARAHGVLGDAYREKQNTRIAFFHFTEASKLDPQGRYKSELSKLRLPVRPKPRAKPVKRAKPKFVITTDVPQGR
jgi:tetratricopeptide (TPR) repeat protein